MSKETFTKLGLVGLGAFLTIITWKYPCIAAMSFGSTVIIFAEFLEELVSTRK